MQEMRAWAIDLWPQAGQVLLIEKSANGVEIIEQLRRDIPGVKPWPASVDKTARAEAAEPDFDSGNVYIAGEPNARHDDYDPSLTPAWAQDVIEECANFPFASHDDLTDMVTQAINYARSKESTKAGISSPVNVSLPPDGGVPIPYVGETAVRTGR